MREKTLKSNAAGRILDIEGVINFRDLGGYQTSDGRQVMWGRVFRSGQMDRPTEKGIKALAALDVKTVVDLRFSQESERYPTLLAGVPNATLLAWKDAAFADAKHQGEEMQMSWKDSLDSHDPLQVREAMRVNYPKKLYSHRLIYRAMLQQIIAGQTPLVFHCAAGKDRTGVAAALILSLLGISDDVIVEDYLVTQSVMHDLVEDWAAGGAGNSDDYDDVKSRLRKYPKEIVQPIFDADEAYIKTLLDYVNTRYQGFENYALETLGIQSKEIIALQDCLLEP